MTTNSRATVSKLTVLGALYLSQGLPYGFFTQALPVMMRQSGRSLEDVGLSSLLAVPWALKFLWAPWVDRHSWRGVGRRKSWVVPIQVVTAAVLAAAGWFEPAGQFSALFAVVLTVNALSATQDIATDGWAVDMLAPTERGLANGLQVGAYRLGMVLGGGVLLMLFARVGWRHSFWLMAAAVLMATVPAALKAESKTGNEHAERAPLAAVHFTRLPGAWPLLGLLFTFKFGESLATAMLRPFMADHGLGLEAVGRVLGTVGFVAGLFGALAGGWLAGRFRRKTALLAGAVVQAAALATYLAAALRFPSENGLALVVGVEHAASGMATATLFTCMMDWSRPGHSGSDYTAQASTVVIASGLASALSGVSAHHFGYSGHFALAFALSLVAVAAVVALFPKVTAAGRTHREG